MKIQPIYPLPTATTPSHNWWQRGLDFLHRHPKLSVLLAGLAITTLSLATWVAALFLENKILQNQLAQQRQIIIQKKAEEAAGLKVRIAEAQQQMSQLKTQMEQQQTDEVLDSREALVSENARLLQELNQLSKPQLGAPLITLEPASLKQAQAAQPKKDLATVIDVPHNLALFTVVLQQAEDKTYQNYFVELTDQKAKNIAWSEQMKKAEGQHIALTFAKRSHAPGKYRLKLYGMNGKKKEFLDQYDMQVNYLPEPVQKKTAKKK